MALGADDYSLYRAAEEKIEGFRESYEDLKDSYFEPFGWESEELYESLGVDYARQLLLDSVPEDARDEENYAIDDSLDLESLQEFEDYTEWNETPHALNAVAGAALTAGGIAAGQPGFALVGGTWALGHGYLSAIQRYNRLRLQKVKDWLEGKEGGR